MKIWIYRPDLANRVDLSCLYDQKGQNYCSWKRNEDTIYQEKVNKIKQKLSSPPDYQVNDYWR